MRGKGTLRRRRLPARPPLCQYSRAEPAAQTAPRSWRPATSRLARVAKAPFSGLLTAPPPPSATRGACIFTTTGHVCALSHLPSPIRRRREQLPSVPVPTRGHDGMPWPNARSKRPRPTQPLFSSETPPLTAGHLLLGQSSCDTSRDAATHDNDLASACRHHSPEAPTPPPPVSHPRSRPYPTSHPPPAPSPHRPCTSTLLIVPAGHTRPYSSRLLSRPQQLSRVKPIHANVSAIS